MANLSDLANRMRATAQEVDVGRVRVVKEVYEKVGSTVVYGTPVDTSRARLNWQGTVGAPAQGVLKPYPSQPSSPGEGATVAMASIRSAASRYTGQQEGLFITNNLDYIDDLNNGSSSQAPANFVEQAIMVGVRAVTNKKILP